MRVAARGDSTATCDDGYLPLKPLSAYAGMSVRTLRGYLAHASRPLPHYRVGGKILVKRSEFDAWMGAFRVNQVDNLDALVNDVLTGL